MAVMKEIASVEQSVETTEILQVEEKAALLEN
jgi:hypothetical protein